MASPAAVDGRAEYRAATQDVLFTKDFNPSLEAVMMDSTLPYGQRFLAWLKRRSWGNWSLYATDGNGEPATQADAVRELGIDKRHISHVVNFCEERRYLYRRGKLLYPTIDPQKSPPPEKSHAPATFSAFLEHWKVTCSSDFHELEVARATIKRLRKLQIAAYKEWLASQTNPGPSLYENGRDFERETPPASQPNVKLEAVGAPPPEEDGRPADGGDAQNESPEPKLPEPQPNGKAEPETPSVKEEVRQYLETLPIPRLHEKVVETVASNITTPELLETFKQETAPGKKIRTWVLVTRIAHELAMEGDRLAKAKRTQADSPPVRTLRDILRGRPS